MASHGEAPLERDDARAAFDRGNRLAQEGQLEEAERAYRQADEAGNPTAAAYVGLFAQSRGAIADAQDAYRRADERGDGLGALRLGLLQAQAGNWDEAEALFHRADERGHDEPPFDVEALLGYRRDAAREQSGSHQSAWANPVLIGAITVLITIVAVFLAYSANRGLPFVPTKELKVDIANGSELVVGNDVREGGFRIGVVSDMRPIELPNGQVGAQLTLKLDQGHAHVPSDSTATILPRSLLGTKFLSLSVGHSSRLIPDGGTLPLSQTSVPVGFDDTLKTFNPPTRTAIQRDLVGFGDALTARGSDLNDTFATLPQLLIHLQPVAAYLSAPSTGLTRFFNALNAFTGAISPVAGVNARLFTDMATTFEAISRDPAALESTIAQSPPTLDVSTDSLRAQQPFLVDFTSLGRALTPATAALRDALPQVNPALEAGISVLPRTPAFNARVQDVFAALRDLARDPGSNVALNGLTATAGVLAPMIRYLGPFQTVCDGWDYFWSFFADHVSEQTTLGQAQRVLLNFANHQPNNVGSLPASQPANGYPAGFPAAATTDAEYLHTGNYLAAIDNSGFADCETGQRGYMKRLNYFDPLHRDLVTDNRTPGDQGPTYAGRPRVPAGETFSRNPQIGPQLPYNPTNP